MLFEQGTNWARNQVHSELSERAVYGHFLAFYLIGCDFIINHVRRFGTGKVGLRGVAHASRDTHPGHRSDPNNRHNFLFVDLTPKKHHPSPYRMNYTEWIVECELAGTPRNREAVLSG